MDIKLNKYIFSYSMLLFLSTQMNANPLNVFISSGPNYTKLNNEQLVQINDAVINDAVINAYQPWQKTNRQIFWAIGANHTVTQKESSFYQLSLGAAGYFFHLGEVNGVEYPLINEGIFDTLNYSYRAKSKTALAEARITYSQYKLKPFALVGLGISWNRFYNYYDTATNPELTAAPASPFSNATQHHFAYELGAGIQYELWNDQSHQMQYTVSAGYQYFNLGKGALGSAPLHTSPDPLKVKNLYTQGMVFSLALSF